MFYVFCHVLQIHLFFIFLFYGLLLVLKVDPLKAFGALAFGFRPIL
jgi:hypothetical protein